MIIQIHRTIGLLASIFLLLIPAAVWSQDGEYYDDELPDINPVQMELMRQTPGTFRAGTNLDITLTILVSQPNPDLTALGLRETLPAGWAFVGMRGVTGQPPAVSPEAGAMGMLEFAWITPPNQFPYTITYTVQIPEDAGGKQFISGQLVYRQFSGELLTAPIITMLNGPDNKPPVVTLQGDNPLILQQGTPFTEPGYTATDETDGNVTNSVQVTGIVNHQVPGTYTLSYTATDRSGNRSTAVTREVQVVRAETPNSPVAGGPNTPGTNAPRSNLPRQRHFGSVPRTAAQGGEVAARELEPGSARDAAPVTDRANTDPALDAHLQQARANHEASVATSIPTTPSQLNRQAITYTRNNNGQEEADEAGPISTVARRVAERVEAGQDITQEALDARAQAPADTATAPAAATSDTKTPMESAEPITLARADDALPALAARAGATPPPAPPGALERLSLSLSALGTGGLIRLGGILLVVGVIFGLAYMAYRGAYRKAPRRKTAAPTTPEPEARG